MRLKEKHWKKYEYSLRKIEQLKKIPKSIPIKIENTKMESNTPKQHQEKKREVGLGNNGMIPKASSYPIEQKKFEPIQKDRYIGSKNQETVIVLKDKKEGESHQQLKDYIWKGLNMLINGIQRITYFNNSNTPINTNNNQPPSFTAYKQLEEEKKIPHNKDNSSPFNPQSNKNKSVKKENDKKEVRKKYPPSNDGMQSVMLESTTSESLLLENQRLRQRIEELEKQNSKLLSTKKEAKRIIRDNQILKDSFINMRNSLMVSTFNQDKEKHEENDNQLLSNFVDLLSSSVSVSQIHSKEENSNPHLLQQKIKALEEKCEKQSQIIQSYHQKWEDLKKSAKERREKKSLSK